MQEQQRQPLVCDDNQALAQHVGPVLTKLREHNRLIADRTAATTATLICCCCFEKKKSMAAEINRDKTFFYLGSRFSAG